jgi:hypothetical protein
MGTRDMIHQRTATDVLIRLDDSHIRRCRPI